MIQNADVFQADAVIFDLEDSVSVVEKDNARQLIKQYLDETKVLPAKVVVRINPVGSDFIKQDIELVRTKKIDYILLPKATNDAINCLDEYLLSIEKELHLEPLRLIALAETSKSIIEVYKIAKHARVDAILLGAEDLCSELEIDRSNQGTEIQFARSRIIYACASNQIIPIDTPNTHVDDEVMLEEDCQRAKQLGMKAKAAIHPSQLEIINRVFSPSKKDIAWAKSVLDAVLQHKDKGAFSLDGKMIDKPIINKAEKIIANAKEFGIL
jgi:citrate lyase subunit beta/citryl-CoA lyase